MRGAGAGGPGAAGAAGAGLAVVDLLALWFAPPPDGDLGLALWALVLGAGLVAVSIAVHVRRAGHAPAVPPAGGSAPATAARVGWLSAAAGLLLLLLPPGLGVGMERPAEVGAVLAVAVLGPWMLLVVVESRRAPGTQRALRAAVLVSGLVAVAATGAQAEPVADAAGWLTGALLFCAGWVRFELTAGDERRQVLWLIAGTCGVVFLNIAALLPDDGATPGWLGLLLGAMSLLGPAGIAIATLAPRMFDVRAVISRTLLLVVMLTVVVAAFAVVDGSIHWATGEQPPIGALGLLAALIAAAYHPVLVRARATLDELLFGGRADPVDTLTRLGSELSAGSSPQEWLDTLRAALAVPALELRRDDEVLARSGPAPSPPSAPGGEREVAVTPLRVGADPVGELVVTLPADQLHLAPTTRAVLTLVAGPLAQALHAVRLTEQLQASRGRVVAALEEERRRVRRDLHDGLGPTLTGIAYSADAVTNLVGSDPDRAAAVLSGLREDAADAIAEVRRIVYGLRPRALDELGLVNAVRQRLERLHAADGRPFVVDVTAPGALPALSAAVEVAAYRVAVEAVTNVARHAGVAAACVRFRLPETGLEIEVTDAGRPGATWRAGVGLDSMRERVEQLGGTLVAGPTPEGGRVHASVPLVLPG